MVKKNSIFKTFYCGIFIVFLLFIAKNGLKFIVFGNKSKSNKNATHSKLSKCVVSFQMTQNDTCVIQMTQMTQHKTTQKFFFTYLINFRKYHCYWRFLSKICQKNWNFFFLNFCYNIFENLYSKKKNFCVFLCCVILCHLNDTCVVSFEWHKWHNTGQSSCNWVKKANVYLNHAWYKANLLDTRPDAIQKQMSWPYMFDKVYTSVCMYVSI